MMRKSRHGRIAESEDEVFNCKSAAVDPKVLLKSGYHGSLDLLEKRKKQDFFIKPTYQSTLPDVPCESKHILVPLNPSRFNLPNSELRPFYEQLVDVKCGVMVDLVGSTLNWTLPSPKEVKLDDKDMLLFEDDIVKEADQLKKRSRAHKTAVPWLRRTEYISAEPSNFRTQCGDKSEYRMDKAIGRKLKCESKWEELGTKDRQARIKSIENSFEVVSAPIVKHYAKPGVYAETVTPVFPDFDLWKYAFAEVSFDTSPSISGNLGAINEAQMKNALLRGMIYDEEEEKEIERIGYFVPDNSLTMSPARAIKESKDDESIQIDYLLARDYIYKMGTNNFSTIQDTLVFIERGGILTYCEIDRRINLNRSIKADSQSSMRGLKVRATHRCPNEKERDEWAQREETLQSDSADINSFDCSNTVSTVASAKSTETMKIETI